MISIKERGHKTRLVGKEEIDLEGIGRRVNIVKIQCMKFSKNKNYFFNQAVVGHAFNPSTWEAEVGGSL